MNRHLPSPALVLATAATATVVSIALAASTPATLHVDGQAVATDVAPITTVGHAYLPLRAISEATGGVTTFEEQTRTIVVHHGAGVLKIRLGERAALVNGKRILLSRAPFSVRGRAYVPSTLIADAFGSSVRYDARHASVDVRTPGVIVAPFPDDSP